MTAVASSNAGPQGRLGRFERSRLVRDPVALHQEARPPRKDDQGATRERARRAPSAPAWQPGHPRRGHQGRHHRHRHRLHARQLRRPRHGRGVRHGACGGDAAGRTRRCSDPARPRVKGGIDLVGDSYDADSDDRSVPAAPAAGSESARLQRARLARRRHRGWLRHARRRRRPTPGAYNATTIVGNAWNVGPGVAPNADLYAIRVFGCDGSTDVVVDAIEWAVDNDMDVINMSLGSPFGSQGFARCDRRENAAQAPAW